MPDLDDYLADLADRLDVGPARCEEILREVRGHLQAAAQAEVEAGQDPATAARLAIGSFGRPGEVAAELNRAYEETRETVRLGPVLVRLFPEGGRLRQRLVRATLGAFVNSLFYPLFFIVLPSLTGSSLLTAPFTSGSELALLLLLFAAPFLLASRLDGLRLRHILALARWALATLWLSALSCLVVVLYWLLHPEVYGGTFATPAWNTGVNPASIASLGIFLILPAFFTLAIRRYLRQLRA